MSPACSANWTSVRSFPRVSGDEPANDYVSSKMEGFSPRERG